MSFCTSPPSFSPVYWILATIIATAFIFVTVQHAAAATGSKGQLHTSPHHPLRPSVPSCELTGHVAETSAAELSPSCGRTWPIYGTWTSPPDDYAAWSYAAANCNGTQLPLPALIKCFQQRTVYSFGNSIMRQFAFELPAFLFGEHVPDRSAQKNACHKVGEAPELCNVTSLDGTVKVHDAWFLYLNGRPTMPTTRATYIAPAWELDTCGDLAVQPCLKSLLAAASPDDILLINPGIIYCLLDPLGVENIRNWRLSEAKAFVAAVRASFSGTVVFVGVSPMQSSGDSLVFPMRYMQERAERYNEQLIPFILREAPEWFVLDVFSIALPVLYTPLYVDAFHFPGPLSKTVWQYLGGMLCVPGEGGVGWARGNSTKTKKS